MGLLNACCQGDLMNGVEQSGTTLCCCVACLNVVLMKPWHVVCLVGTGMWVDVAKLQPGRLSHTCLVLLQPDSKLEKQLVAVICGELHSVLGGLERVSFGMCLTLLVCSTCV